MDKIRISKVDHVSFCKRGDRVKGTLHIAAHHLIFSYLPPAAPSTSTSNDSQQQHHHQPPPAKPRAKEIWITYPMIATCTYKPMPLATRQPCAIRLRCRDFTYVAFQFDDEIQARSAYDSIKSLTCGLRSVERLYAFTFEPPPAEKKINGWQIYDARKEYKRMGISPKGLDRGWRLTDINSDYVYSPTYPSLLAVPSTVSDNVLKYGKDYRSRARIPVLTYLHPVNNCSITRSSQPRVGMFQEKRNPQDERLVAAIFATSKPLPGPGMPVLDSQGQQTDPEMQQSAPSTGNVSPVSLEGNATSLSTGDHDPQSKIYGAQQKNFIVDARPQVNAVANQASGMGSENMEHYKDATKEFLGIANIHVMRDSINKVSEAFAHSDYTALPPNQDILTKSRWLEYISLVIRGSVLVARQVGINHSHVLIHCSDGWDRTSQISALSQICLDPYYRTLEGFIVLVEKDFVSFGHMFRHRSGFLGSDKWFEIENERIGGNRKADSIAGSNGSGGGTAFGQAFSTAKGFFLKKNDSRDSLDVEEGQADGSPTSARNSTSTKDDKHVTKVKETSPIFHQFLDATYQMLRQHPSRFEFNERFLRRLLYQLYSCQYGTFLFDSERERVEARAYDRTRSVWDHFLSRKEQFLNDQYDPTIDDKIPGKERLLFPDSTKVQWWHELFGRTYDEMNGTSYAPAASLPKEKEPIVTGVENADFAAGSAVNGNSIQTQSAAAFANGAARISAGFESLRIGKGSASAPPVEDPVPEIDSGTMRSTNGTSSNNTERLSFSAFARDNAFRDT